SIVVEDWSEPVHPATPAARLALPVMKPADDPVPVSPAAREAPPASPEADDKAVPATMVLGEAAAMVVRPLAPAPPTHGATAAAPDLAPDPLEETHENTEPLAVKETPPAPRPRPPARPSGLGPPRVRTGPVPPPRDRSPVYEEVPTRPSEPAVPPPPTPTSPGVAAAPPAGGGRGLAVAVIAGAAVLLVALVGWWAVARRPKVDQTAAATAEASPLAVSPAAPGTPVAPAVIPEEVTVVAPAANETASPARPSPGAAGVPATVRTPVVVAAPTATRPAPPPPAAPVNPVPGLMAQAEQAMAAKRYNDAIAKFGDVLKLEPENAEAATRKLHAQGDRASMGRYFFTAVTMSEGKASGGGLKGFDGGSVVKSQCECAVTYEVDPANPAQGERYAVSIFLRNDSKKDIKPQSIAASVTVNGSASNRPLSLATKEVKRGQKTLIGRLDDTWMVGTTSWSMEGAVSAGGNTYRAQLTWELRVPPGQ
ncbi:MAG TPA: hypothetical protein VGQ33_18825, partial [Vicinamibacteria bacterium]|nr:hypothetical protein [Vicinamibacteria bacterium]